jgi:hypothetical protein
MITDTRPPHPMRTLVWVALTWVFSAISAAVAIYHRDWDCALIAVNAVVIAAGWVFASSRWAEWQAQALSANRELERRAHDAP